MLPYVSAENSLEGRAFDLLKESNKIGKGITNQLYHDYRRLREQLISSLGQENPHISPFDAISYAQIILDRVLVIAFAEDKGLLPKNTMETAFQHRDHDNPRLVWENFKGLFRAIDKGNSDLGIPGYNGGLFRENEALGTLQLSDLLCESFKQLGEYDFNTEVSVTVLGHIFEQSITDIEALQANAKEENPIPVKGTVTGKRKHEGVVYTPDNIACFIVMQTLGSYLKERFDILWSQYAKERTKNDTWKNDKAEIAFWESYQEVLRTIKVLDPACGSGAFLIAAFDYLYAEYTRVNNKLLDLKGTYNLFDLNKEILNQNLYGVDINHESIEISKLSLWLKTAKRGKVLDSLDHNLRVGNSLIQDNAYSSHPFCWKEAFPEVFQAGGFDIVLGNPPYVRQELIASIKPYLEKNYQIYNGVADLYTYFFELGMCLLKPGGKLGYISSSTFFKTASGSSLRQFLQTNASIERVVDFGDVQVFEGVTTYAVVMIMEKNIASVDHSFQFLSLKSPPKTDLSILFDTQSISICQQQLNNGNWQLEKNECAKLRDKIVKGKKLLKEVYGSPHRGVLTGLNEAFVIDRATRDMLATKDPKAHEVIKPFLEGKDLKKWHVEPRELYIIFTRRGIDIEKYPSIKKYLEHFKKRLEPKPKGWSGKWEGRKFGSYKWYEIQDNIAYYKEFESPKIIYNHFQNNPCYSFSKDNVYLNNKCYIWPKAGFFELGLMNSKVMWFIFSSMTTMLRGGYYEATTQNIEQLPIPDVTDTQKSIIASIAEKCQEASEELYKIQQLVRHRINDFALDIKEAKLSERLKNWWNLDFPSFRKEIQKVFKIDIPVKERSDWESYFNERKVKMDTLTNRLNMLEAELNSRVYELFNLTDNEIILLETALQEME